MTSAALRLDHSGSESFADDLPVGSRLLQGQFTIESFLNAGGFGITYVARDSLNRQVAIKECFPSSFCRRSGQRVGAKSQQRQDDFRSMVQLFVQEAMNLSRLDHPNIVRVHQVFHDNDTAYMAMDYVRGPDLLETVEGTQPRLPPQQIMLLLSRMLDAVGHVHAQGFLHRDISPDNILLDTGTGEPVLIDFGAARKDETRKSRALSGLRVVKDGYSPQEFYISGSAQAPCSDLYALAASFSHLITGEPPKTSRERLSSIANRQGDPQLPLLGRVSGYPAAFLAAIDKAMSIFPRDRLQSAKAWAEMIASDEPFQPAPVPPNALDPAVDPAVGATRPAAVSSAAVPLPPPLPPQRDRLVRAAAFVLLLAGLASLAGEIYDRFLAADRGALLAPVTTDRFAVVDLSNPLKGSADLPVTESLPATGPAGTANAGSTVAPVFPKASATGDPRALTRHVAVLAVSGPGTAFPQSEDSLRANGLVELPLGIGARPYLVVRSTGHAMTPGAASARSSIQAALNPAVSPWLTGRGNLPKDEHNIVVATCDFAVQPTSQVTFGKCSGTAATVQRQLV